MKIIKKNLEIFAHFIFENFDNMIVTSISQAAFKPADVIPFFKEGSETLKE